ncbi:methyltransferase domain-containing protein [Pikeienuella piscinae]|uniref:Small RNA 2'-O-methyltransferase n=1 Tax=Pikeienuella piscinae TaxID=2748098 RepID=A0A7L5BWE4_9RHOB|nr:methyltransferase domain-containing protein [Pikeienuella piscinae]QIE55761.1 methyltransferase domain-containing protein [Pikeienuella piscinae]
MTSWLHEERLAAVIGAIRASGARSVLDLGCGEGDLILRLLGVPEIERIAGVDLSLPALERLRAALKTRQDGGRVKLLHGSMIAPPPGLTGFDCAALVETIEHLAPETLSRLETALFGGLRPRTVAITTPNVEFNGLLGVKPGRFRRPDHRFEWGRARFRAWAAGVAARTGYGVAHEDIAGRHPTLGGASQMAVFTRAAGVFESDGS